MLATSSQTTSCVPILSRRQSNQGTFAYHAGLNRPQRPEVGDWFTGNFLLGDGTVERLEFGTQDQGSSRTLRFEGAASYLMS
jgi:hypothetical protein